MTVKFLFVEQPTPINGNFALDRVWSPQGGAAVGKINNNVLQAGMYAVPDAEGFAQQNPTTQLTDAGPKGGGPPDPPAALVKLGLTKQAMLVAMGQGREGDVG
jgi:hypothetical protein